MSIIKKALSNIKDGALETTTLLEVLTATWFAALFFLLVWGLFNLFYYSFRIVSKLFKPCFVFLGASEKWAQELEANVKKGF